MGRRSRDGLDALLPPVASWFRETFGDPDPAPAAGLAGDRGGPEHPDLRPDRLGQDPGRVPGLPRPPLANAAHRAPGLRILYISPLKALNQDICRNLQVPLDGIVATADSIGASRWPASARRSGPATRRPPSASGSPGGRPTS